MSPHSSTLSLDNDSRLSLLLASWDLILSQSFLLPHPSHHPIAGHQRPKRRNGEERTFTNLFPKCYIVEIVLKKLNKE